MLRFAGGECHPEAGAAPGFPPCYRSFETARNTALSFFCSGSTAQFKVTEIGITPSPLKIQLLTKKTQ